MFNRATYKAEQSAIERIRAAYPNEYQLTLAKRIKSQSHFVGTELELAAEASHRPLLSIYSVIRRYDAELQQIADAITAPFSSAHVMAATA